MNTIRFLTLLFFIAFNTTVKGQSVDQELTINYSFSFYNGPYYGEKLVLKATKNYALSKLIGYTETPTKVRGEIILSIQEYNIYFFQDYTTQSMYYEHRFFKDKNLFVKEDLNLFNWKLTNETKTILGYVCTKATTYYRGRDYIAYFTTEIPFKAAPWKFHGLPGVLLEVNSTDDLFKIKAQNLAIQKATNKLTNPFITKKLLTWEAFTDEYIKKIKKSHQRTIADIKSNPVLSKIVSNPSKSPFTQNIEIIFEGNLPYNQREQFKLKNK